MKSTVYTFDPSLYVAVGIGLPVVMTLFIYIVDNADVFKVRPGSRWEMNP
jgi:hypothetical protein